MSSGIGSGIQILIKHLKDSEKKKGSNLSYKTACYLVETCYGVDYGKGVTGKQVLRVLEDCGYIKIFHDHIKIIEEEL